MDFVLKIIFDQNGDAKWWNILGVCLAFVSLTIIVGAVQHYFNVGLERKKLEMSQESNTDSKLKTVLSPKPTQPEFSTTPSQYSDKTREVAAKIYSKLGEIYRETDAAMMWRTNATAEKSMLHILNLRQEFHDYFRNNDVHLPKATADLILKFEQDVSHTYHCFEMNQLEKKSAPKNDHNLILEEQRINEVWWNDITPKLEKLKDNLRTITAQ